MTENENNTDQVTEYLAVATPVIQLMAKLVPSHKPETVASVMMMEGAKLLRRIFKTDAYFTLLDSIYAECRKLKVEEPKAD